MDRHTDASISEAKNIAELHKRFPIETDASGEFRIVDKGGPNVVLLSTHEAITEAREAWCVVVRSRLKETAERNGNYTLDGQKCVE